MHATVAVGIDIGGTSTKLALVNDQGESEHLVTLPTRADEGVEAFIERILNQVAMLQEAAARRDLPLAGIGIAVAGFVDAAHTQMVFNTNIEWLQGFPLRAAFEDRFDCRVALEVDSNAAALAEYRFGVGSNAQRFLVLSLGTGVGGGMVVGGQLLRIANQCLGDIGHVIIQPGGPACASGCKGCAEAIISAPGLERLVAGWVHAYPLSPLSRIVRDSGGISARQVIQAAGEGDILATEALRHVAHGLGTLLASITPILAPDCIAIAGGVSEAGARLLGPAEETYRFLCGSAYQQNTNLRKAKLGWQATLIGAACPLL